MKYGFLFICLFPMMAWATPCAELVGSCDYYQCLSQTLKCSEKDYPLNFAFKYCNQFQNEKLKYSQEGQKFISVIAPCLQMAIETESNDLSCQSIHTLAGNHHVKCYTENHYCTLNQKDKNLIGRTVFKTMLFDKVFQRTAIRINEACAPRRPQGK